MREIIPQEIEIENVDIWFQDEARVSQRGTLTRTWAKKGTRRRLTRQQQFEYAYVFAQELIKVLVWYCLQPIPMLWLST